MIPVYQPDLSGNEKAYLNECIDSSWISSKGRFIDSFEGAFQSFTDAKYATSVSNGTVAIHLALEALGIGPGDEVIVPTLTYIASVNPIVQVGATPVFVDSVESTWQISPSDIREKLSSRTKAIMVVHLYGQSAEMTEIMQIAEEHNLFVIEDCAEAFGTFYAGQHVGTFGDVGTFSFFGNKTITCGEGGMVTAKNKLVYERMKHLKSQGVSVEKQYWHDAIAFNYRLTNMQAAIGLAQIERADFFIKRKREIAGFYRENLSDLPLQVHAEQPNTLHSYWMTSILLADAAKRDLLRVYLTKNGIETRPLFYPVHTMPMYATGQSFPVAESIGSRGINLPSWPGLSTADLDKICSKIRDFFCEI
jgi:perosamine synthetase